MPCGDQGKFRARPGEDALPGRGALARASTLRLSSRKADDSENRSRASRAQLRQDLSVTKRKVNWLGWSRYYAGRGFELFGLVLVTWAMFLFFGDQRDAPDARDGPVAAWCSSSSVGSSPDNIRKERRNESRLSGGPLELTAPHSGSLREPTFISAAGPTFHCNAPGLRPG